VRYISRYKEEGSTVSLITHMAACALSPCDTHRARQLLGLWLGNTTVDVI
jgi:hypothetical protein